MTIVDTTVWIDYVRGTSNLQTEWLDSEFSHKAVGLTDLILCELLQGIRSDSQVRRVQREIRRFELFSTGGEELATASAANYRSLRRRGITVRTTVGCLIATFCVMNGFSLLHRDRDFDPFEKHLGLRVIHPRVS